MTDGGGQLCFSLPQHKIVLKFQSIKNQLKTENKKADQSWIYTPLGVKKSVPSDPIARLKKTKNEMSFGCPRSSQRTVISV